MTSSRLAGCGSGGVGLSFPQEESGKDAIANNIARGEAHDLLVVCDLDVVQLLLGDATLVIIGALIAPNECFHLLIGIDILNFYFPFVAVGVVVYGLVVGIYVEVGCIDSSLSLFVGVVGVLDGSLLAFDTISRLIELNLC